MIGLTFDLILSILFLLLSVDGSLVKLLGVVGVVLF